MAEWQSADTTANGIRIHYYRTGGDKPPVVLAHGATDDGLCWTRVARLLEGEYDVIMPDARGHGLSDAPENGYGASELAADLAGLVRALGIERPAVVGHSMGGLTALFLAADFPDALRCAVLEDPPLRQASGGQTEGERAAMEAWLLRTRQELKERRAMGREALISVARSDNPTWSEEELGPWADSKLRVSAAFLAHGRLLQDWREALSRVSCPLLLITGDPERGAIVTPEIAEEARRLQPSLQVLQLRGAGHNIRREQFDGFMQAVRSFLASP